MIAQFKIKADKQEDWDLGLENNQDAYGRAVYLYAAKWASLMDPLVADGVPVAKCAKDTSRKADAEYGITGFQYGCAVSILSHAWEHGEDLRRWHNLDTQVHDEGEKANERALLRAAFPEPTPRKPTTTDHVAWAEYNASQARNLAGLDGLPAPEESDTVPREPGCQCQLEAGDSPCRVHGDDAGTVDLAPYEVPGPLHDLLTSVARAADDLEGSSPKGDRIRNQLLTAMARFRAEVAQPAAPERNGFQIRFDGPPGPESGRFVECETLDGKGVSIGRWQQDGEYWLLVVDGQAPREANNAP